jgi:hypothetical protein
VLKATGKVPEEILKRSADVPGEMYQNLLSFVVYKYISSFMSNGVFLYNLSSLHINVYVRICTWQAGQDRPV